MDGEAKRFIGTVRNLLKPEYPLCRVALRLPGLQILYYQLPAKILTIRRNTVGPCKRSAAGQSGTRLSRGDCLAGWRCAYPAYKFFVINYLKKILTIRRNTVGPCKRSAAGQSGTEPEPEWLSVRQVALIP
ncbi:MAG: hypothetical protein E7B59_03080 [Enterobacteriaceae bacterium]|nr:hypothetical protein [Enterobacteriaceae bacterium]